MTAPWRGLGAALVATLVAAVMASCSGVSLTKTPLPIQSYSDGYEVTLEFASVLNLPDSAKVAMDGIVIGKVTDVELGPGRVDVVVRIGPDTKIPAASHAVLQQDTVLGDIYVALLRVPGASGAALPAGGVLPLAQTTSPPQLEDTMAVLANFFSSGSVQRIQETVRGMNAATPQGDGEVRRLAAQTATDMADLAADINQVDEWLAGVAGTAQTLQENTDLFRYYVSPQGMADWDRTTFASTYIGTILPSIGSIYEGGFWLTPMLESLGDASGALRGVGMDLAADGSVWARLLPAGLAFLRAPSVDITSITDDDGREVSSGVESLLRMLGAIP